MTSRSGVGSSSAILSIRAVGSGRAGPLGLATVGSGATGGCVRHTDGCTSNFMVPSHLSSTWITCAGTRHAATPAHLEPVTPHENTNRGLAGKGTRRPRSYATACLKGHPYVDGSWRWRPRRDGRPTRVCLVCDRAASRRFRARHHREPQPATSCRNGHVYVDGSYSIRRWSNGRVSRTCLLCAADRSRRFRAKSNA